MIRYLQEVNFVYAQLVNANVRMTTAVVLLIALAKSVMSWLLRLVDKDANVDLAVNVLQRKDVVNANV